MGDFNSWAFFLFAFCLGALMLWLALKGQTQELRRQIGELRGRELELQSSIQKELAQKSGWQERAFMADKLEKDLERRHRTIDDLNDDIRMLTAQVADRGAELREVRAHAEDKIVELRRAQENLSQAFRGLSAEALSSNNEQFMHLARATFDQWQNSSKGQLDEKQVAIDNIIKPLKEALTQVNAKIQGLEVSREGAYEALRHQVQNLAETHAQLQVEARQLNKALHSPISRGRWGEIQLKRVVELAGMVPYCDFVEQQKIVSDDGEFRPDLIVRLPSSRSIVVDAKVPLDSYLKSMEAKTEAEAEKHLDDHAEQLRRHILVLGKKSYWKAINPSPEFAVLFLPGEVFLSAALSRRPELLEEGVQRGVIISTPPTLIALLHAVAYGWKQEGLTENAQKVIGLAEQLCDRIGKMAEHFHKLGRNLGASVESYNQTVGTLETRVLSTARKLEQIGGGQQIKRSELAVVEKVPRGLRENIWNKGIDVA